MRRGSKHPLERVEGGMLDCADKLAARLLDADGLRAEPRRSGLLSRQPLLHQSLLRTDVAEEIVRALAVDVGTVWQSHAIYAPIKICEQMTLSPGIVPERNINPALPAAE
jgi:hypothetical protein